MPPVRTYISRNPQVPNTPVLFNIVTDHLSMTCWLSDEQTRIIRDSLNLVLGEQTCPVQSTSN
jgi:hypothetical protein